VADALSLAEEAIEQAQRDPVRARTLALEALHDGDPEVVSVAERALGVVARELSDPAEALRHLRRAIAVAERSGLRQRAGEARMTHGLVLLYAGRSAAARRELDRACDQLEGPERARAEAQRALVLQRLGDTDAALAAYRRAIAQLARAGDRLWEARARTNRGVLRAYQGAVTAAASDLERAEALYQELGETLAAAQVRHNRGFVAARAGDVPAALGFYDQAEPVLRELGVPGWISLVDRCELLLSVPLVAEALALAERVVAELARLRMAADLAEARLQLASAQLLAGEPGAALATAAAAERAFAAQERPGWALLAAQLRLRTTLATGRRPPAWIERAGQLATALEAAGRREPALDARIAGAGLALELGRRDPARALVAPARPRGGQPAGVRVRAWHAVGLGRLADGDRTGALRALEAAVRAGDQDRLALGATELRARAGVAQTAAARLGLRLALRDGSPAAVLRWSELLRGGAALRRPVRPPDDPELASLLAELRGVAAERLQRGDRGLARRQAVLEARLRARARHAPAGDAAPLPRPTLGALRERLGERALVSWFTVDGLLHALVLTRRRSRVVAVPDWPVGELDHLRFALSRTTAIEPAASRLDDALLAPLGRELGDRELVLVPTGALHHLPFAALPSCDGRPLSLAPSAWLWWTAAAAPPAAARRVLVAGPGLQHAEAELAALALPADTVLSGAEATVAATVQALDGAGTAHVAAHGTFRADHPLFSSLRLVDGPLTGYDLERLDRAPRLVVLSACDAGLAEPGEGLLGLAATLLPRGTATLVAGLGPVGDAAARRLMERFHAGLRAGRSPAAALAEAQQALGPAGALFACLGAG
jgi:hypothetical protein